VIKSFRNRALKRLVENDDRSGISPQHAKKIILILNALESATRVSDMALPGFGLHQLKGEYAGHHAVSVSGNWRIRFRFENGDAYEVDYLDYH